MLTADTITDEQIRATVDTLPDGHPDVTACGNALGRHGFVHSSDEHDECPEWCTACRYERLGRARIAEILNARVHATIAPPSFADEEIAEQIAAWLDGKAEHYKHNRNIGPYSTELAAAIRRGEYKRAAKEPR